MPLSMSYIGYYFQHRTLQIYNSTREISNANELRNSHSIGFACFFFQKRTSTFLPEIVSASYFSVCIIHSEAETIGG
jgi:hypothetical protein